MITLTKPEANYIADALLAGCFALIEVQRTVTKGSLEEASANNTYAALHVAMNLLEERIAAE